MLSRRYCHLHPWSPPLLFGEGGGGQQPQRQADGDAYGPPVVGGAVGYGGEDGGTQEGDEGEYLPDVHQAYLQQSQQW